MPFPSSGCQVCRSRHIKCDETRPTCLNCRKSGRHCAGWRATTGSLLFLSENVYASTQTRRPRGGARWVPEFSTVDSSAEEAVDDSRKSSPSSASDTASAPALQLIEEDGLTSVSRGKANTRVSPCLSQPIGDIALGYFAHAFFRDISLSPEYMWSLIQPHFQPNRQPAGDDALGLAFSALSLVHYGRSNGVSAAMIEGQKQYSSALRQIRNAIEDKSIALTDEILAAVMIMASYENNVANFDQHKLLSYSFQHHQGATVLLKIRQENRTGNCPPNTLDQCIRRQVIKSSIYRSIPVPEWLQDGSAFGEDDYQLELDRCFIRLASLRHHVAKVFYDEGNVLQLRNVNAKPLVERLIADSVSIFQSLNSWRATLDPQYHYEVIYGESADLPYGAEAFFYSSTMHKFRSAADAALWTRYQGTRLFTASMLTKLLFVWRHLVLDDPDRYSAVEQMVRNDACVTSDEICAGVPFAFGVDFNTRKDVGTIIDEATPAAVCSLNWPFIILSGSLTSSDSQRQWVQEKMMFIAKITGNATIETLAKMKLQHHSRLRPAALLEKKEQGG